MNKIITFLLIAVTSTLASTSTTNISKVNTQWSFEASMTAQTIENSKSPSVGATALYNFSEELEFGLRAMTSLSGNEFETGHSLQLVQRYNFYRSNTDLFVEFNQGYAEDKFDNYTLMGFGMGLNHNFSEQISIGGIAGLDKVFSVSGTSPKISTFVSVRI